MVKSNNTSGYQGVSWNAGRSKWIAKMKHQGEVVFTAGFDDKEAAARAYDEARASVGLSRVNFPDDAPDDEIEGADEAAARAFAARRPFEKEWDRLSPAEQRACMRMLAVPEFGRLVLRFTGCACEQGWWGQFIIQLNKHWKAELEGRDADAAVHRDVQQRPLRPRRVLAVRAAAGEAACALY